MYLNESRDKQNAFTTYNWFQQLKAVYAKYDPTGYVYNHILLLLLLVDVEVKF